MQTLHELRFSATPHQLPRFHTCPRCDKVGLNRENSFSWAFSRVPSLNCHHFTSTRLHTALQTASLQGCSSRSSFTSSSVCSHSAASLHPCSLSWFQKSCYSFLVEKQPKFNVVNTFHWLSSWLLSCANAPAPKRTFWGTEVQLEATAVLFR